jgi:hypothetical protein
LTGEQVPVALAVTQPVPHDATDSWLPVALVQDAPPTTFGESKKYGAAAGASSRRDLEEFLAVRAGDCETRQKRQWKESDVSH